MFELLYWIGFMLDWVLHPITWAFIVIYSVTETYKFVKPKLIKQYVTKNIFITGGQRTLFIGFAVVLSLLVGFCCHLTISVIDYEYNKPLGSHMELTLPEGHNE